MNVYRILFKLVATACLGFYAITGYTLALSEAELKSYLNQQLDVRIRLLASEVAELDNLEISLSYPAKNNVSRYRLKYEVLKSGKDNFLKITSHDVIREPIIEFTLDIGWSDGHVVREYSFLIDPPRN
jgi:pilus assembly protein FimV